MGLHSKVRPVIRTKGNLPCEREEGIIQFAEELYDFLFDYMDMPPGASLDMTQKHARMVSKAFTFPGFEDDEIYSILFRRVEKKRKSNRKS